MTDGPGATPLPITFLGLTIATTLYAGFETGILPKADFHTLGWLVLAIPVPMQFFPSIWGWIRGELASSSSPPRRGSSSRSRPKPSTRSSCVGGAPCGAVSRR